MRQRGLAEQLDSYGIFDKIVIVDNQSTDDSVDKLQYLQSRTILLVIAEQNGGYSCENNFGAQILKESDIEIMFISNPDVAVESEDVMKICDLMESEEYSMLSGLEYDIFGNVSADSLPNLPTYKDDLVSCFFIGRKWNTVKYQKEVDYTKQINDAELLHGSFSQ